MQKIAENVLRHPLNILWAAVLRLPVNLYFTKGDMRGIMITFDKKYPWRFLDGGCYIAEKCA